MKPTLRIIHGQKEWPTMWGHRANVGAYAVDVAEDIRQDLLATGWVTEVGTGQYSRDEEGERYIEIIAYFVSEDARDYILRHGIPDRKLQASNE